MKSKELKTYNLPKDDLLISSIDAKPNYVFILAFLLGAILLFIESSRVYGLTIITIVIVMYIYLPKVVLMEFFQEYLVLYNRADNNSCVLVYYDEIISWNYSWSANRDYLNIELENGESERIEAFSKTIFESNMNRFLKEKKKKNK